MIKLSGRARRIASYDQASAHWLRTALGSKPAHGDYLCLLIRLLGSAGADAITHLNGLKPLVHVPPQEEKRLHRLKNLGALPGASVIVFISASQEDQAIAALEAGDFAEPLLMMPGSAEGALDAPANQSAPQPMPDFSPVKDRIVYQRAPVLGLIDDEIGYLNARFCQTQEDGTLASRVQAVWVQHAPRAGATSMTSGPVVRAAEIRSMLDDVQEGRVRETAAYQRFLPPEIAAAQRGLAAVTHGTHVMDLACGFEPAEAPDIPIFAVEMPARALDAPSARRGASYLVQGIRWLLHASLDYIDDLNAAALAADDGEGPVTYLVPDIVLTSSIGSYAGPKDGTGVFAELVGAELDLVNAMRTAENLGDGYEYRATLFQSFGNAYQGNQSARHVSSGRTEPVDWHLPRADRATSLLEMRVSGSKLTKLWMRFAGQDFEIKALKQHQYRQVSIDGAPVLRIYRGANEAGGRQVYSVLVRPTEGLGDAEFTLAPSGPIRLVADTEGPADITWQVERDDVPFGYFGEGKQSHLSDPSANGWSPQSRDYSAPQTSSAILREGSELAQAHTPHPAIVTVGAALADAPIYAPTASGYSAAGSLDASISARQGPDVSATGDDGVALWGVLATGTASGSIARLAGTSVAAPQAARRMLMTGEMPLNKVPLSTRTGQRFEDRSGSRSARVSG